MREGQKWVPYGKVGRAKGLRGDLFVDSYNPTSELLYELEEIRVGKAPEFAVPMKINSVSEQGGRFLVQFDGHGTVDEAKRLTGNEIFVPRAALPELPDGEYYHCDLVGCEVFTKDGQRIGELKEVMTTKSNDIYVVMNGQGEKLFPATNDVLVSVDVQEGRIVLDPPEVTDEV